MPRTDSDRSQALRLLPPVDQILRLDALAGWPRPLLLRAARAWLDAARAAVLAGKLDAAGLQAQTAPAALAQALAARCAEASRRRHQRVYNAALERN